MVYAKIIYLLMVVISGALCTVEDYVIMSQCAHNKAINLAAEGTVSVTDISQTQNITIVGRPDFVNNNFKIALYAKETQRYLCFNDHWKLVGMKELQDTCYFNEAIVHGYFVFRSVVDFQRRIGFTQRGRAVGPKKTVNDACYMFTKIPSDQFFHQHTHFSSPKTKSTTTKIPKTEYTHTPYSTHVGRGSGGGQRTKTNRFKNQHPRQDDSLTHSHSGNGHGSGSGSGNGNGNKKYKKQRNGNRQRQQKQKQEMQQQIRGHSYNLSNPKNSTYLNSSRQNLVLSQHSLNNHTNKNHSNNNSNNNNHPPQNHQVRHHHNDPNKVARRQQHDQKQKTKMRQRVRPSPSSSAEVTATAVSKKAATTLFTTAKAINSIKPHFTLSTSYLEINPTSVVPTISTDATLENRNTMTSTVVVTKRKGRRRKGEKILKISLQKKMETSEEKTDKDYSYSSPVSPTYEEDEEFMTSSTDYAWMTNDIMLSSFKPTSASLPSWETWYPSSSATYTEEDAIYSSPSTAIYSSASITETNADRLVSSTSKSSPITYFDKNTLSSQTSVPLPTSVFSTTLTENGIDETIAPTVTTDLGTTTTNTSTFTQPDFWSTILHDSTDADLATNGFTRETFNTYSTPKLENTHNALNTDEFEDSNASSTQQIKDDLEDSTASSPLNATTDDEESSDIFSLSPTDLTADENNHTTLMDGSTAEITSSRVYDKSSEAATTTTATYTSDCASSTASTQNRSKSMTDCKFATKTTATIANNYKLKQTKTTPTQHSTQNYKVSKMEMINKDTTSSSLNTLLIKSDKTTSLPETTLTTSLRSLSPSSPHPSKTLAPATALQYLNPVEKSINNSFTSAKKDTYAAEITTLTATDFSSTKTSPVPSSPLSTRKTLRKSTQRLLATPFHQLTYVRNEAGDIDIDSIDNISIYPELLDNDNDEPLVKPSTSRLTMISGYLPTSATATLPESIRIAKIKINRERKRMLRLRNVGNYA